MMVVLENRFGRYLLHLISVAALVWALCCLSHSYTALADAPASKPILVNFDDHNAPVMYLENGAAKGLYPEIAAEVFRRLNLPHTFKSIPWNRALAEAYGDQAGIGGIYWSKERAARLDYSAPIYVEKMMIYVRPNKSFVFNKIKDLKGKKLAITQGTVYGREFDEAKASGLFTSEENLGDEQNFEKLAQGRIDAVVASEIAGSNLLRKKNMKDAAIALKHPVSILTVHIAFAKGKHLELLGEINKELAALRSDGTLAKLSKQYTEK
jgi:polar amino acid transport system substrate-binding protein